MTEEVICDLTAVAEKKDITISQNPGTAEIIGNDTLVYRAIYNLVENAIKYNNTGGNVTVSIKEDSEFASVIISDNGPGIEQEDWQHIFEPFFRIDKSRSRDMGWCRSWSCPCKRDLLANTVVMFMLYKVQKTEHKLH